ncbi:MAG: hypothetical protein ABIO71_09395 [Caldimonas sp.]
MKIFGIDLRKPSFGETTAAAIMGIGCWIASVGMFKASGHPLAAVDAGALLVVCVWSTLGVRLGLRLDHGPRHLAAYGLVGTVLLGCYQGALAVAA